MTHAFVFGEAGGDYVGDIKCETWTVSVTSANTSAGPYTAIASGVCDANVWHAPSGAVTVFDNATFVRVAFTGLSDAAV